MMEIGERGSERGEWNRKRERDEEVGGAPRAATVRRRSIRGVPSPSLMRVADQTLSRLSSVARIYWV